MEDKLNELQKKADKLYKENGLTDEVIAGVLMVLPGQ